MVYFQCENCIESLKKKQVENHYLTKCRNAHHFTCLSCQKVFDRETIKNHTQCISEEEKYQKGDNLKKKTQIINKPKEIVKVDLSTLKWSGFRKTSKKILMSKENYKMDLNELMKDLAKIYARDQKDIVENVDMDLLKKLFFNKLEDDPKFVIDLSKNTIRYKN